MAGTGVDREILVVDESNRPLGSATRARVHAQQLVHRAIHGIVYRGDGRIYLSERDDVVGRDKLDISVTEHVWPGESYEQTARRALARRLGIPRADPVVLTDVFRDRDVHDGDPVLDGREIVDDRFMQVFAARFDGEIAFDRRVYKAGAWLEVAAVDALVACEPERLTSHFCKDWQRVRERVGALVERARLG